MMKYLKYILLLLPFITACDEKDEIDESVNDKKWWYNFEFSTKNLSFSKQGGTQTIKVFNSDECILGPVEKKNSRGETLGYQSPTLEDSEIVLDELSASFNSQDSTITIKLLPIDADSITWKIYCYYRVSIGGIITIKQN